MTRKPEFGDMTPDEQAARLKARKDAEVTVLDNGEVEIIERPKPYVADPSLGPDRVYRTEIADAIMLRIARGEPLMRICEDDDMPPMSTVQRWLRENRDGIRLKYASARAEQADYFADEIIAIADDARNDWMDKQTRAGVIRVVDHEHVQRSKLRIDARKWAAEKQNPRRYGQRTHVEVEAEVKVQPAGEIDYSKLSVEELETLQALLNKAKHTNDAGPDTAVEDQSGAKLELEGDG